MIDWKHPANIDFLLVSQFSVKGAFYTCLLGWTPNDNTERLSLAEVAERLDLPQVLRHNAKFDFEKLLRRPSRPPRSHRLSIQPEPISSSGEK